MTYLKLLSENQRKSGFTELLVFALKVRGGPEEWFPFTFVQLNKPWLRGHRLQGPHADQNKFKRKIMYLRKYFFEKTVEYFLALKFQEALYYSYFFPVT